MKLLRGKLKEYNTKIKSLKEEMKKWRDQSFTQEEEIENLKQYLTEIMDKYGKAKNDISKIQKLKRNTKKHKRKRQEMENIIEYLGEENKQMKREMHLMKKTFTKLEKKLKSKISKIRRDNKEIHNYYNDPSNKRLSMKKKADLIILENELM